MPLNMAGATALYGAAYGLFPIGWIILNLIFLYQLTVDKGHFDTLRASGIAVVPHAFHDHHAYQAEDLAFGSDLPVLMTEKDAVKCAAFANERHYLVPVRGDLPEPFWIAFLDRF